MSRSTPAPNRKYSRTRRAGAVAATAYGVRLYTKGNRAKYGAQATTIYKDARKVTGVTGIFHGRSQGALFHKGYSWKQTGGYKSSAGHLAYRVGHGNGKYTMGAAGVAAAAGGTAWAIHHHRQNQERSKTMAAKKKGSWSNGKSPAQGGTPKKMTKPEGSKGKLKSRMSTGSKAAAKRGTSPLDGRKRGKK